MEGERKGDGEGEEERRGRDVPWNGTCKAFLEGDLYRCA